MANKTIPERGGNAGGNYPGIVKFKKVTFGPDTTADVLVTDCGVYKLFDVGEPIVVLTSWTQINTAFTAAVDATLGDTASAARLADVATVASTTAGSILVASTLAVPFNDTIGLDINLTLTGAVPAAGLGTVWLKYAIAD